MNDTNILIVGVGGQGTLLASRILGTLATINNLDCKLSEVHGMSQRGGSVVTHVRIGHKICSPIIEEGEADFIFSLEKLEALRWSNYLRPSGVLLVNNQEIFPMPVIAGEKQYPQNIIENLKENGKNVVLIDALDLARKVGSTKATNVVMIGALCALQNISYDEAEYAVISNVKEQFIELNKKALKSGYIAMS